MIKVVNLVSLIIAPIVVRYSQMSVAVLVVTVLLVALLGWAISRSKRQSEPLNLSDAPQKA